MRFRISGAYTVIISLTLLVSMAMVGCKKETTTVVPPPPTATTDPAMKPTAIPVLKEKIKNKEPLNLNDQIALHAMKPEERAELMDQMRKARPPQK